VLAMLRHGCGSFLVVVTPVLPQDGEGATPSQFAIRSSAASGASPQPMPPTRSSADAVKRDKSLNTGNPAWGAIARSHRMSSQRAQRVIIDIRLTTAPVFALTVYRAASTRHS
jgi:hypothetical protein